MSAAVVAAAGIGFGAGLAVPDEPADTTPVKTGALGPDLPEFEGSEGAGQVYETLTDGGFDDSRPSVLDGAYLVGPRVTNATIRAGRYTLTSRPKPYDPDRPDAGGCTWQVAVTPGAFRAAARSPLWNRPRKPVEEIALSPGNYFVSSGCGHWLRNID